MADRLGQVLKLWRAAGLREVARAMTRRTAALAHVGSRLRMLNDQSSLESAVSCVVGGRVEPGDLIFAMQKPAEILEFLRAVSERPPTIVVEIGTAAAGVLYLLTRVAGPDAQLISIDLPGGAFGGGYAPWRKSIYRRLARPGQSMSLIRGSSHSGHVRAKVERILRRRPIDLLFIDGDHTLKGVTSDLKHFGARVRPGGLIALHDVVPNPLEPTIEVPLLWAKLTEGGSGRLFRDPSPPPGYGIGLLTREEAFSTEDLWRSGGVR